METIFLIARIFGKKLNNNVKNLMEKQLAKKRSIVSGSEISKFFGAINPFKKDNVHQNDFMENLGILILKIHLPIQFVENM
jgi:hypothetical protein